MLNKGKGRTTVWENEDTKAEVLYSYTQDVKANKTKIHVGEILVTPKKGALMQGTFSIGKECD